MSHALPRWTHAGTSVPVMDGDRDSMTLDKPAHNIITGTNSAATANNVGAAKAGGLGGLVGAAGVLSKPPSVKPELTKQPSTGLGLSVEGAAASATATNVSVHA